jgi:uncharacterized protein YjiS (DUF1127 family)
MTTRILRTVAPPSLRRALRSLAALAEARRERRALVRLDARLLRDIGLTPDQARIEATRWTAPDHWRT